MRDNRFYFGFFLIIFALGVDPAATSDEISPEELERWFNSDTVEPPQYLQKQVNEGELRFLDSRPSGSVHHHDNTLVILPGSLDDGWIIMQQCHRNMDRVDRIEVVFRAGRVRKLKIDRSENIDKLWVENSSIQIEGVSENAVLCFSGWVRALLINDDGSFTLHSGPFMRRFLDGYYPMHVSLDVRFAGTGLKVLEISPPGQTGFSVSLEPNSLSYDAWFEGRLKTMVHFSADIL